MDARDLDRVFREVRPQLIARLTRTFGPAQSDRVEAEVQEAFVKALEQWSTSGVPESPLAWLLTVARNRLLDAARYQGTFAAHEPQLEGWTQALLEEAQHAPRPRLRPELDDDLLKMMFVACHGVIGLESQVPFALRTLCGFDEEQIARALLLERDAVAKRLVRARRALRDAQLSFELPPRPELEARRGSVLTVLYALFSAGYGAPEREELCFEAIRLLSTLAAHPIGDVPEAHALLALMCFQASRLPARLDGQGTLLSLVEQDRTLWDRKLVERGFGHLAASARGETLSAYHLEAAIAACHARAASFEATPWEQIAGLYDQLAQQSSSPVVALNRAIAHGFAHGPRAGLDLLAPLDSNEALRRTASLSAARAALLDRLGDRAEAELAWGEALERAVDDAERRFIERRLAAR